MAAVSPTFLIKLTGDQNVTKINKTISWTLTSKEEKTLVVNVSDPPVRFTLADIGTNIRLVVFESTASFTVTVSKDSELMDFEVQDIFIMSPSDIFTATFDYFEITTDSSSDQTIHCNLLGD